jgi:hypothetical protein
MGDEDDTTLSFTIKVKKYKNSNSGYIPLNSVIMEFFNGLDAGVRDTMELVFDIKTMTPTIRLKQKDLTQKDREIFERLEKKLREQYGRE